MAGALVGDEVDGAVAGGADVRRQLAQVLDVAAGAERADDVGRRRRERR